MPHTQQSLKTQERLYRRLRREPAIKLLTAQIRPNQPLKLFTVNRTLAIWSGGDVEQWFGNLGGYDRCDPHLAACYRRYHAKNLAYAADYRRWGKLDTARDLVTKARAARLNKQTWRNLP